MYTVLNETIILIMDIGQKRWGKKQKQTTKQNQTKQKQNTGKEMGHFFFWRNQDKFPIDHFTHADHMVSDFAKFDQEQYLILVSVLLSPNQYIK